jgi:hypothetical protein
MTHITFFIELFTEALQDNTWINSKPPSWRYTQHLQNDEGMAMIKALCPNLAPICTSSKTGAPVQMTLNDEGHTII